MTRFWRDLDPRTKVLVALLWSAGLVLAPPRVCLVALVPLVLLVGSALSRARLASLGRGVLVLWVLTLLANAIFTGGERMGPEFLGWLRPGVEGVRNGLAQGSRLAGLAGIAAWLTSTVGALELASSLEWSVRGWVGLRLRVHRLTLPLVLALRLVPAMGAEAKRLLEVDRLRGRTPRGFRSLGRLPLLFPLWLVGVVEKGEALSLALTLRGYRPEGIRGFAREFRFRPGDGALAVGGVAGFLLLVRW